MSKQGKERRGAASSTGIDDKAVHKNGSRSRARMRIETGADALTRVLPFIGQRDNLRLTTLVLALGYKDSRQFTESVESLLASLNIPAEIAELQQEDILI
ncbi:hypothetical protein [Vibrio hangzhouensis]|uniref:hypothetical protein n=1 Tax=Vibrio hangzhouensis TaxID=462991 RepID=UPI001C9556DA|nr:hypothetical protein [Vibrio hangzhouensis]MBY6197713.1 hypothetical protein [Vibrio hangzhouensis]